CRARARVTFPAKPLLVAAVNPCPCGFAGERSRRCSCSMERVRAYRARLSGPLLDRMDLQVMLPPVDLSSLRSSVPGESSAKVRERVLSARAIQAGRRAAGEVSARTNGELTLRELERVAAPDDAGSRILSAAVERLGLSARAYGKVLRVARTIADLDGISSVRAAHVAEAVATRLFDREAPSGAAELPSSASN
ncbi:MAG: ATP-binding protein, partial [Polyangiaceae bacterium]|nr:ATP-binding protein [Polyangiaceae bacterium]